MSDREKNRRENDALQSGEGNLAFGQDERDFGAGGSQEPVNTQGEGDPADREVGHDPTVPKGQSPRSGQTGS